MGQSTHRKFAITTGEVVFIFLFGLFIGALCMSIAGCSGEFTNASKTQDSGASDSMVFSQKESSQTVRESGPSIRPDSDSSPQQRVEGSVRESGSETDNRRIIDAGAGESSTPQIDATPIRVDAAEDSGPLYCQDCPPIAGRPGCCFELFKQCSSLNYLNVCVRPQ